MTVQRHTTLAEAFLRSGKVRDLYELPKTHRLLLAASDRISAFDVVLPTLIPDKGRVLTGLSRFWFAETTAIVANHLLDTDPAIIADSFAASIEDRAVPLEGPDGTSVTAAGITGPLDGWRGRIMICRPTRVVPIEAVVRGYLSGSGWKEYRERGTVCGIALPPGLRESDRLPVPIFTPATKAPLGQHDENVSFDGAIEHIARELLHVGRHVGRDEDGHTAAERREDDEARLAEAGRIAERIREVSLRLYGYGAAVAERAGIVLADTKFEFGLAFTGDDEPGGPAEERIGRRPIGSPMLPIPPGSIESLVVLIDEVMTPDSSRFWDATTYAPGGPQASFDKQFVRDWLETQAWDKTDPGPELPADVVAGTRERYVAAFERITGASFDRYLREDVVAR
jgi:phosphoribosylaminoimidazole-succinocarboxamide synthase